jgi:hypothetical protein
VPDVVVHHCTVRMVRTGGWSWGRAPDALAEAALDALPDLIEALVSDTPALAERELAAPIEVRARVSLAELERGGPAALRAALGASLRAAADAARRPAGKAARNGGAPEAMAQPSQVASSRRRRVAAPGLHELVLRWLREGVLDAVLELLAPPTLEAWNTAVLGAPAAALAGARPTLDADALSMVEGLRDALPEPETRAELLRSRLALAAAAAAPNADWAAAATLTDAARPVEVDAEPAGSARRDFIATTAAGSDGAFGTATRLPARRERSPAAPRAAAVVLALPFLAAVPLARIGYFDVLGASLSGARLVGDAQAFAMALALKVLEPPELASLPTVASKRAAAAFAGAEVPSAELTRLAAHAPLFASALDAVIAISATSRRGRDALLLHRSPTGDFVLVDPADSSPIALAAAPEDVARILRAISRPPVRVSGEARSPEVLDVLTAARVPADARRRARWRGPLDLHRLDEALTALEVRQAAPLGADRTLERSLSLAAGFALASLGRWLWAGDGETDPLLVLDRLGDIEARIRCEGERIRVTLPMGRRRRDLADAGVLRDLDGLPWLDGQRVEFS